MRELKSTIESIMNFMEGDTISLKDLHARNNSHFYQSRNRQTPNYNGISELPPLNEAVENFEKNLILKAIIKGKGNYAEAARLLKVPRQTLHNKIKKYGIKKDFIVE